MQPDPTLQNTPASPNGTAQQSANSSASTVGQTQAPLTPAQPAAPTPAVTDNSTNTPSTKGLSQTLSDTSLRGNIDALVSQGAPHDVIQSYINNYQGDGKGGYVLKGSQAQAQNEFSAPKSTLLDKIASFLPGGDLVKAGISTAAGNVTNNQQGAIDAASQSGDIEKKLADQIVKDKELGKNTTRLENALSQLRNESSAATSQIGDLNTSGESDKQVIGSAVNLAGTLAGGAELAGSGEGIVTAGKGALEGLKTGAIGGALAGVGSGVGNSIANGDSFGKVVGKGALEGVIGGFTGGAAGAALGSTAGAIAKATPDVQSTIDAINPELKGKQAIGAYKDVVTGGRDLTPASVFKEGVLSPTQQTINLGNRIANPLTLSDGTVLDAMPLGNKPDVNLNTLKQGLSDTESALSTALKGDPEVNFNAQKPQLQSDLQELKTNGPREFTTNIKDNTNVYNKVINFAQDLVKGSDDSMEGIRDARTAFDNQAKKEFPSAFGPDGTIDTKTPAGAAIKSARDTINEHLYNAAPNGSDIKALVAREADIFRATENIAPKANGEAGQSLLKKTGKLIKAHPVGAAATAYVGDKALKKFTGVGF